MRAKHQGIEPDARDPFADQACVLAGRHALALPTSTDEQELTGLLAG
jgi:hypothetical protein